MDEEVYTSVDRLIDEGSRFRRYQAAVVAMCLSCLILDGFDVQAIGYVAPAIIREWGISKSALTPVFSAGLFGMLVGSFVLSSLADRVGRRPVLICATVFFSICMILTSLVQSLPALIVLRFVTGFGLGGVMPNAMALAGEYSPKRVRVTVMMIVASGFTIGAALGGVAAASLIAAAGWRSVFVVGGLVPLLLSTVMFFSLPESLSFRLSRGAKALDLLPILKRIRPNWTPPARLHLLVEERGEDTGSIADLFAPARRFGTFILWSLNFMNLIVLYFLSSWLPTLLTSTGRPESVAILAGTAVQIGGIVGTLIMGKLIDRHGFKRVLMPVFLVAGAAIFAIGQPLPTWGLFAAVAAAGFCIVGGQPALNSLAASFYPPAIRSTGIGWSLGVGRIGSVLGPVIGGVLIGRDWSNAGLFAILVLPVAALFALMSIMPPLPTGSAVAVDHH